MLALACWLACCWLAAPGLPTAAAAAASPYGSAAQCSEGDYEPTCTQAARDWALQGYAWNASSAPALAYAVPDEAPDGAGDCCALCDAHPECVLFDYSPASTDLATPPSCRLYDAGPLFAAGGRDGALVRDGRSVASFLDWKAVPGRRWARTGLMSGGEIAADLLSLTPDACATNCGDTCGCALWQLDPANAGQPCRLLLLPDPPSGGGVVNAFGAPAASPYPVAAADGPGGAERGEAAGLLLGQPLATNVRSAEFRWDEAAEDGERFTVAGNLSRSMPAEVSRGGRLAVAKAQGWYSWELDGSLNNTGALLGVHDTEHTARAGQRGRTTCCWL